MAHNLYGDRLVLAGEPGWHFLGTVVPRSTKLRLKEAMKVSGNDYPITIVSLPNLVMADGKEVDMSSRVAIVRHPNGNDPTYQMLEVVSTDYQLITNQELVNWFDELSGHFPVETMGSLGKGETFFFTLDAGEVEVNGELVHQFFLVTDNKVALQKTRIAYTPVRVVCNNTLISGLAAATMDIAVPHRTGNKDAIQEMAGVAENLIKRQEEVNKLFGVMGKTYISVNEFKDICTNILYPDKSSTSDEDEAIEVKIPSLADRLFNIDKRTKDVKDRELVYQLAEKYNDESPTELKGSTWNYWQATVEWADWRKGRGDGQYRSAIFGQRANEKVKAFNELARFIK